MCALALLHWSWPRAHSFTSPSLSSLRDLISFMIHDVELSSGLVAVECGMMKSLEPWNVLSQIYGPCTRKCVATRIEHTSIINHGYSAINSTSSSTGTFSVTCNSASRLFHSLIQSKTRGWISCLLLRHTSDDIQCNSLKSDFDQLNMLHGVT